LKSINRKVHKGQRKVRKDFLEKFSIHPENEPTFRVAGGQKMQKATLAGASTKQLYIAP